MTIDSSDRRSGGPTRAGEATIRRLRPFLTFLVLGSFGAEAAADTFRATYALSIIGLSIGNAYAKANLQPNAYQIDIGVKLGGVAALVSNARGAATASGTIANIDILPSAYANTSANSNETRTVRMSLDAGNVKAKEITPPFPDPEERLPVTDAMKRRIVDPVSGLLMRVPDGQSLVGPAACDRKVHVYDGLVRFDVTLSYTGTKQVQTRGYSGPVTICAARYAPIAGFRRDSSATRYMANNREMEVWLAPYEKLRIVVPFHVSIKTNAGTLLIQASEFHLE